MNPRRVAELHRQLAQLHGELADALLEGEAVEAAPTEPTRTKPRPRRQLYRPPANITDLDRQRAKRALEKAGLWQGQAKK